MDGARSAIETAARASYGRLIAYLSVRSRDVAIAEDALSEAFAAALRTWPETGVPETPEAWLLTAARRVVGHDTRHQRVRHAALPAIELAYEEAMTRTSPEFPDDRLRLMFVCSHPEIDAGARAPLMLQTVLGLDAARIAAAFLTSPSAMSQRLVRAKTRIRESGIAFETPAGNVLTERIADVLSAIYAAYGVGWDAISGADSGVRGLASEAMFLARLTAHLMPEQPEAKGLLALLLYCEARTAARRDASGVLIPLTAQDYRLWSRDMIIEAEGLLTAASRFGVFGRFQTEAAIQSVHVQRAVTGITQVRALVHLYDFLCSEHPSLGAMVSRAVVHADDGRPQEALVMLDELPPQAVRTYQPWWCARAHILEHLGRADEARASLVSAIGLTEEPGQRIFLSRKLDAISGV
ncbi:MAG: sigma factor [Hyphomonadaceae bacterium]|nr:sigma factor [Hyphomonadaceae bacterium]